MKTKLDQINNVPVKQIRAGDNDRTVFDADALHALAADIQANGLAQPITVRPIDDATYQFEIVAGERRFRAVSSLGWATIPAIIREYSDEQAAAIMLSENVHRVDIDPIDEANAYQKRMEKFGWSVSETAEKSNRNAKHVAARLLLLNLVPDVQQLIRTKHISDTFGEVMAPLDSNRQRIALAYLTGTTKPVLKEFKILCGNLLAEQANETLFDLASFTNPETVIQHAVDERNAIRSANYARRFPIDERLPEMKKTGGIGESFAAYLQMLLTSDDPHLRDVAAPIVGTLYDSMLRFGMAFPPNKAKSDKVRPTNPA